MAQFHAEDMDFLGLLNYIVQKPHAKWRFRGAKVCPKWLQGKVMMNWYSLITRWEIGHEVENSEKVENPEFTVAWWQSMTRTPMTTSMIAWNCTMRTPTTTSTVIHSAWASMVARIVSSVARYHMICTRAATQDVWVFSCISIVMVIWVFLFSLNLPFYFLHFFTSLFFLLQFLKFVVNLHTPPNVSMDSTDEFSLSTGYEPEAYDCFEPYMQLLDSPALFSFKSPLRTPTTMTLHSKTCSIKYFERKPITLYEKTCLSVCRRRQCPIERSDPLEIDPADPVSTDPETRYGLCSTSKKSKFFRVPSKN